MFTWQGWICTVLCRRWLLRSLSELPRHAVGSSWSPPPLWVLRWCSASVPKTSDISRSDAGVSMLSYAQPWCLLWPVYSRWSVRSPSVRSGTAATRADTGAQCPSESTARRRSQTDHFTDKIEAEDAVYFGRGPAWLDQPGPMLLGVWWPSSCRVRGSKSTNSRPTSRLDRHASQGRRNWFHR